MKGNSRVKYVMFTLVTMFFLILIHSTEEYGFSAAETGVIENKRSLVEETGESEVNSEISKMDSKALDGELIIKNTSTSSQNPVLTAQSITYSINVTNPNATSLSNIKLKINTDIDDVSRLVYLSSAKDKTGKDLLKSGNVSLKNNLVSIENLPENESFTIKYSVSTVFPGFNDDTDITNTVALFSSDANLVLSADSITECNISKLKINPPISKYVAESNSDGMIVPGEIVTYRILIDSEYVPLTTRDVNIRDSMLENLPEFVTYNDDFSVKYYTKSEWAKPQIATSGNIENGDFTIAEVPVHSSIVLTYSIRVNTIPLDINPIYSVVTNNGTNPIDEKTGQPITCPNEYPQWCAQTLNITVRDCLVPIRSAGTLSSQSSYDICEVPIINPSIPGSDPMKAKTDISKSLTESNPNEIADIGETIEYKIDIVNNGTVPAYNTVVRDSMLENLPSYVTFNDDVAITEDIVTSGQLIAGDFKIESIPAGSTVSITYSIQINDTPSEVAELSNIATQGGNDPQICLGNDENCSEALLPLHPLEIIEGNETVSDVIVDEIPSETNSEVVSETNSEVESEIVENEDEIEIVNNENKLELVSEALSNSEVSLDETTLITSSTNEKKVTKLTTTGGVEVVTMLFLVTIGIYLVVLKKTV